MIRQLRSLLYRVELPNPQHSVRQRRTEWYERGALQTLVTHALSLILAGEDIRMRTRRRER